jgi:hypothetical protein
MGREVALADRPTRRPRWPALPHTQPLLASTSQSNLTARHFDEALGARGSHVRGISGLTAPRERRRRPDDQHIFIRRGWKATAVGHLSAKCREPLCGPPFPQVTSNRRGRSYVLSLRPVMCSRHSRAWLLAELVCPTAHQPHSPPSTCTYALPRCHLTVPSGCGFALSIGPRFAVHLRMMPARGRTPGAPIADGGWVQDNYAISEEQLPG